MDRWAHGPLLAVADTFREGMSRAGLIELPAGEPGPSLWPDATLQMRRGCYRVCQIEAAVTQT